MMNTHELAEQLNNFCKDFDHYEYQDALNPGETEEDAIADIERQLLDPVSTNGVRQTLIDIKEEMDLDEEHDEEMYATLIGLLSEIDVLTHSQFPFRVRITKGFLAGKEAAAIRHGIADDSQIIVRPDSSKFVYGFPYSYMKTI